MSKRYIKEDPDMWYAIINLEERAANFKIIKTMLSEAVKECPKSGELWSMMIENQPKSSRIRATLNASEICPNDPYLMNVTARIFWGELKKEKATVWFERSLLANPGIGDTWVYYYLLQHELKDEIVKAEILKRCVQSEPTEGRLWKECAQRPVNWSLTTEQILMKVIDDAKAHMYTIKGRV